MSKNIAINQRGFGLLLLILGVTILLIVTVFSLTTKRSEDENGNPQNLIQTDQKARQDIDHINSQLQEQQTDFNNQ